MNYEAFAEFYDRFFGDFLEDLPFYQGYAERAGSPLLEVGCGTGRLTIPLAAAGFRVVGLDASAAMLARARARAERVGVADRILWIQGDATREIPPGPYSMAFIPLNTFLHFDSLEAQQAVLRHLHRALEPGGLLLLDCLNPDAALLGENGQLYARSWHEDAETGTVLVWLEARRVDAATQRLELLILMEEHRADGTWRRWAFPSRMRFLWPGELRLLLESCGFALEEMFGTYDLAPYQEDSPQMLVVARRVL
ncbi:class I SAM-dependent methyltransferase [Thermoflexus sp.]|uniref:class I SAM-dependent methyltransferase n=1 Tax=Thermoflexus sp. TaxID=1969742 RepID=UPI0035E44BC8